ncbi:hypothetical protein HWV62_13016 [Athelia sp. TMB]|nr:hypothetical protein HWV62_13016 [Athelia sp. TMB]
MSDARRGLPLLSGPPPSPPEGSRAESGCRKCNKEFNILFTRRCKCSHCVTAAGKGQLRSQPLSKLRKYAEAYNIKVDGVVEKDDLLDRIVRARNFYRKYSVPNRASGARPKSLFSRLDPTQPSPPSPQTRAPPNRPQAQRPEFARPDLEPDDPPAPPPRPPQSDPPPSQNQYRPPPNSPPPQNQSQNQNQNQYPPRPPAPERPSAIPNLRTSPRQPPPRQQPPPQASPRPQHPYSAPGTGARPQGHPPPPRPSSVHNTSPPDPPQNYTPRAEPRPRATSAAPRPPPAASPPRAAAAPVVPPSLDDLLNLRPEGIKALSVGTLKAILFQNHVNARLLLEKSDLVDKVVMLVEAERSERERKALIEAEELREARERRMRERAMFDDPPPGPDVSPVEHHDHMDLGEPEEKAGEKEGEKEKEKAAPLPPKAQAMAEHLERTGLCVICQDEDANIAIVDCGYVPSRFASFVYHR